MSLSSLSLTTKPEPRDKTWENQKISKQNQTGFNVRHKNTINLHFTYFTYLLTGLSPFMTFSLEMDQA